MNQQDKHRHHLQPRHFLKGFAAPSFYERQKVPDIWVYTKGVPFNTGINPRLESVNDVGYSENFYAFTREDRTIDYNTYEDALNKDFEQPGVPILEKIKRLEEISDDEKRIFARYVGSTVTRGKWWRGVGEKALSESVSEMSERLLSSIASDEKRKEVNDAIEKGFKKIKNGELMRSTIIRKANDLSEILEQMVWRFVVAPLGMFYLTSDKPIYYYFLKRPESELVFPLSSEVMLSLSWQRYLAPSLGWKPMAGGFWEASSKTVEVSRDIICRNAFTEIYSCRNPKWLETFISNRCG